MFPVLRLGPLSIPAPAFILLFGFFIGNYLAARKAKSFSIDPEIIDNVTWIGLLSGIIGARLSFIAGSPAAFKGNLSSIFSLNPALLDPFGGFVIAVGAAILILSRREIGYWQFLDSLTPFFGTVLASLFFSQFASGNSYGIPSDLPWAIDLWGTMRHPVQIYLFVFSLITLIVLLITAPLIRKPFGSLFLIFGSVTLSYMLFLSYFQSPSGSQVGHFRLDQILYWIGLLIFLTLFNLLQDIAIPKENNEIKE